MPTVEFHFDVGSPNSYFARIAIPAIEQRTGVNVTYVPVLLGGIFKATGNASPAVTLQGIKNKGEYQQIETQRFIKKHGITDYQFNPNFPVNTLQLMRGAIAAEADGELDPYLTAICHHMWEKPKKMDDPDVIKAALDESGLDGAKYMERIQDPAVKTKLIENTEASVARGSFGCPTFYVGDEIFFGKDKLVEFEEEIVRQNG
jgi:2-hydroxychromene-2-carboxylate isomerase